MCYFLPSDYSLGCWTDLMFDQAVMIDKTEMSLVP